MAGMTRLDPMPLFDELADGYDRLVPFYPTFGQRLMDLLVREPGWDLLDIGAGRGAVARAAAARGFTVTATDASPRMVANLGADHPDINAVVMEPHRLRLKESSFDIATASFVIHVVDDPAQVLREVCRVVRPGGLVAMTVPVPARGEEPAEGPLDVAGAFSRAGLTDLRQESIEARLGAGSVARVLHRRADVHLGRLPA
jgi:ubiquinone/menaquinone biosynthesis C-methylase UbiE